MTVHSVVVADVVSIVVSIVIGDYSACGRVEILSVLEAIVLDDRVLRTFSTKLDVGS